MWWSRRPSFRFPSRLFILGHTKFGMPGSRAWSDRRMGRGPFSPGLCRTSLCSTRACHYHHGPDWSTWIGFLEALWVRNLSLIWYFIGFVLRTKSADYYDVWTIYFSVRKNKYYCGPSYREKNCTQSGAVRSSEIGGLCLMKWPSEMLQNLPYFM